MRVSPSRRRRWNNIMIVLVIVFIGVLNLPTFIKAYLLDPPKAEVSTYPYVLNHDKPLQQLNFAQFSLTKNSQGEWQASQTLSITPNELVAHWQELKGTIIDDKTMKSLETKLGNPATVEVWYQGQEEPQRVTYYQSDKFWLFNTWQGQWVAISVAKSYIIPHQAK
ncbi:hypothetical protein [Vibrio porteresiae]|uniref:50S ribosomal protein L33 n=1 Tax=Vibrio porteresiae DSM 19223 TaxID=1123496 RepID=A0ABZ0QFD3_9VIBR|nr:hypothetical protein [Vibrio porteresiae]WPC74223.1 hypothetical protein R8Z52_02885 [Vibrio porteresiae DSM 19223]